MFVTIKNKKEENRTCILFYMIFLFVEYIIFNSMLKFIFYGEDVVDSMSSNIRWIRSSQLKREQAVWLMEHSVTDCVK